MVIRRKDGSIYRLRGPNKLLAGQEFWFDDDKVIVHNFDELSKIILDMPTPIPPLVDEPQITSVSSKQIELPQNTNDIGLSKKDESKSEPLSNKSEQKSESLSNKQDKPLSEQRSEPLKEQRSEHRRLRRCELFCLPAKVSQYRDPLYGETAMRLEYESPFKFQAAIVDDKDTTISFWSTVKQVTEKSVLFHRSRYRWWQVNSINADSSGDGFIMQCIPSNLKPDFSSD